MSRLKTRTVSVQLAEALQAEGGGQEVVLEVVEDVGHAYASFFTVENVGKMLDFLDRHLGHTARARKGDAELKENATD